MLTAYASSANTANQVASDTTLELAKLLQLVITKIPLWIAAAIMIFASVIVAKIVRSMVESKLAEKGVGEEHQELQILGGRMAYTVMLVLGITAGLKVAGIDLTSIIAAGAFGIGFALKDLIMNFLAGIMILLSRHFTIGDFINIGGTLGKVVEIQSRVTILQAIDGTKVIVPNADLFKKQVTSYTSNPFRRIEIIVGVDYRHDLKNVLKICNKIVKETKGVLIEPKPAILVDDFGYHSVKIKIKAWVDAKGGWLKVKSRLVTNIKETFDEYGIVIPWPIRTIAYDKDSERVEKKLEEEREEQKAEATTPQVQVTQQVPANPPAQNPEVPLKPLGETN